MTLKRIEEKMVTREDMDAGRAKEVTSVKELLDEM